MPSVMVSLDPGIRGCGVARFVGGVLVGAAYLKNPVMSAGAGPAARMAKEVAAWVQAYDTAVDLLVVEWPRVYASRIRAGETKADPNDLVALAGVDSAAAALINAREVDSIAPSDWKGQLPKPKKGQPYIVEQRVRSRLLQAETEVVDGVDVPLSLSHNVFDAIGLGLHRLGRFERRRVIAS